MHKIENISFQVEIHKNETQHAYEKKYVHFLKYRFLPKVEELFDKWNMAYPNIKCTIEEIALNVNEEEINEEELQKKLIRQLSIQLAKINVINPEKTEDIKVKITVEPSKIDAFIQYLATGSLPNYSTTKEIKQWLLKELKFTQKQKERIKQVIQKNFTNFKRLANVFKEENYSKLIRIITDKKTSLISKEFARKIVQILISKIQLKGTKKEQEIWIDKLQKTTTIQELSKKIIELLKEKEQQISLTEIERIKLKLIYAQFRFENAKPIEDNLFEELKIILKSKTELQKIKNEQKKQQKNKIQKEQEEKRVDIKNNQNKEKEDTIKNILKKEKGVNKSKENKVVKENNSEALGEEKINSENKEKAIKTNKKVKIITEKAGLVIVHPFIKELLKSTVLLTEENKITDVNKAVLMLHYLATGNQKALDLELSFEKILLGIPLEEVITIPKKLTEKEKHQCEVLLKAVVQHWNIYKSNATNSLRSMFLQRSGIVDYTEKKITIEIEKQAQDLLLDKLPWGIGILKLPWLKQLIYTKW